MSTIVITADIVARRNVGMLCPIHKLPLIAGVNRETGEFFYTCDFCDDWRTADALAAKVAPVLRRIADPAEKRRRVRSCLLARRSY